ncbi:MAG: HPr(Ser) kinase/phosphatase [Oscillospiraceae bacterium]|nr:HPr(Ser) kinase/phosphatase [Oscillospiraceae bacterium]
MESKFTTLMSKIVKNFELETVFSPDGNLEFPISTSEVNRPGLEISGYLEYFDRERIQVLGKTEISYISTLPSEERLAKLDAFFSRKPPAIVISRGLEPSEEMLISAKKYGVPLFRTQSSTSSFISSLISRLNVELAPRITRHGVLVEVYGEGILLLGESGVGKSETAIELIKRGHRLIADDAVEIRRVSDITLVGSAPENIRHFLELRGVGIINARRLFGMGAIKVTQKIDAVIQLEPWDANKTYDRIGLENTSVEILGLNIPSLTIPVRPGRNLAIIIEVAAMNNRQKKMGYNAAQELLQKLDMADSAEQTVNYDWDQY